MASSFQSCLAIDNADGVEALELVEADAQAVGAVSLRVTARRQVVEFLKLLARAQAGGVQLRRQIQLMHQPVQPTFEAD